MRYPTACRKGHDYTPENTYYDTIGRRRCKACNLLHQEAHRRREQAKRPPVLCAYCGQPFRRPVSRSGHVAYCSDECAKQALRIQRAEYRERNALYGTCVICEKGFFYRYANNNQHKKTCSKVCFRELRRRQMLEAPKVFGRPRTLTPTSRVA